MFAWDAEISNSGPLFAENSEHTLGDSNLDNHCSESLQETVVDPAVDVCLRHGTAMNMKNSRLLRTHYVLAIALNT